ncbi:hypothetical protein BH09BAC2_BH09BAC2_02650 [soil metagenome]
MATFKIRNIRTIFTIYWILLAYIIAALIWWFIALDRQNRLMTDYKVQEVMQNDPERSSKIEILKEEEKRKTGQYIGEGATFLLLIIAGAVFVFRAVRRQFRQNRQQQHFMMAITHELKTPIAVTKLNLETLLKHNLPEATRQKLISNTLQEANRLNDLCSNMLLAGQIEAGGYNITFERIDFSEVVTKSIHEYASRFSNRNFEKEIQENIFFTGDPFLLKIAADNLLDNAIKYSPREEPVIISLNEQNNNICLSVKDTGKGIEDAEKIKIFNKFYRAGNRHTREAKGTGLGLFLTKTIVLLHKGNIRVLNNVPTGSIFEISFESV